LVTAQWQLTCFVATALPLPVLLRVWDCILVDRCSATVFRFCGALFQLTRDELLSARDAGDVYLVLMGIGAQIKDATPLLNAAYALPWDSMLDPASLAQRRSIHAKRIAAGGDWETSVCSSAEEPSLAQAKMSEPSVLEEARFAPPSRASMDNSRKGSSGAAQLLAAHHRNAADSCSAHEMESTSSNMPGRNSLRSSIPSDSGVHENSLRTSVRRADRECPPAKARSSICHACAEKQYITMDSTASSCANTAGAEYFARDAALMVIECMDEGWMVIDGAPPPPSRESHAFEPPDGWACDLLDGDTTCVTCTSLSPSCARGAGSGASRASVAHAQIALVDDWAMVDSDECRCGLSQCLSCIRGGRASHRPPLSYVILQLETPLIHEAHFANPKLASKLSQHSDANASYAHMEGSPSKARAHLAPGDENTLQLGVREPRRQGYEAMEACKPHVGTANSNGRIGAVEREIVAQGDRDNVVVRQRAPIVRRVMARLDALLSFPLHLPLGAHAWPPVPGFPEE